MSKPKLVKCNVCREMVPKRSTFAITDSPTGGKRRACKIHPGIKNIREERHSMQVQNAKVAYRKEKNNG